MFPEVLSWLSSCFPDVALIIVSSKVLFRCCQSYQSYPSLGVSQVFTSRSSHSPKLAYPCMCVCVCVCVAWPLICKQVSFLEPAASHSSSGLA